MFLRIFKNGELVKTCHRTETADKTIASIDRGKIEVEGHCSLDECTAWMEWRQRVYNRYPGALILIQNPEVR